MRFYFKGLKNKNSKEIEKEKDDKIKELNQEILSLKSKYDTNIVLINEKNSIIKELNSSINELKNEIDSNKNSYNNDIVKLKSQIEKNNNNKGNEIDELKKVISIFLIKWALSIISPKFLISNFQFHKILPFIFYLKR